jgi:branched-chain amino acid aminotransferase
MDRFASFNFRIVDPHEIRLNAIGSAAFYGKGVFTTAAIVEGQVFLWEKHWSRLEENAVRLGIGLDGINKETVEGEFAKLISQNGRRDGRARITLFDESAAGPWRSPTSGTSVLIVTAERRLARQGLRLTVSPCLFNSTSPLAGVKSCNYLEQLLAAEEAKKRDTPSLETGCLPGTTREYVLENLECKEVESGLGELRNADAIFLTSAGIGVAAVAEFDEIELRALKHPIADLLPF